MAIQLTTRVVAPPEVLVQEAQKESVLLNLSTGRYFGLDEVGTRMWKVCTTAASLQNAAESLASEYDVDPTQLQQDLQDLVEKLVAHGLLAVGN